jgi:ubiquinone/menaquinone biosynthesis C-methylase UbiE
MNEQVDEQYWNFKKHALAGYNAGFRTYDQLYGEEQEKKYERCSRYLGEDADKAILDCGCGTGTLIRRLVRQRGFLVGVDYSKVMLGLAKKRVGTVRNVALVCADADSLPFKSETFDKVVSFTMLGNMPIVAMTIREMARVAKCRALILLSSVRKNIETSEVLASLRKASVRVKEFINDSVLNDWIAIVEKSSEHWN